MKKTLQMTALLMSAVMLLSACQPSQEQPQPNGKGVSLASAQEAFLGKVDVDYAHDLALRIIEIRDNEKLGYRTAGSPGELAAGDLLASEMEVIGLTSVTKDPFTLDTWTFDHAELTFAGEGDSDRTAILGAYQTQFDTEGPKSFEVVYAGQGTEADYEGLDVAGKLVLIDINQRENWWINYPAYEAHTRGAAAVLSAQDGGYSEVSPDALNAQDICGPADAPAFSISRTDADALKALVEASGGVATVTLDAKSDVVLDGTSYNVWGVIPGRRADEMILMSAHYDSYFDGFQDDNIAIALMMGIAKSLVDSGYQPEKTLVFCAMAAEEWGVSNTRYDWSTGAFNQIFRVRPDWVGKVMANINFELPGYNMDYPATQIRCSYELASFAADLGAMLPTVEGTFPEGVEVIVPTQTWSDDFSLSIAGIPASVTALRGDFAQTRYHSQMDDATTYDAGALRYHYNMYGTMMLAYDRMAVAPLDFTTRFDKLFETIDDALWGHLGLDASEEALASGVKQTALAADLRVATAEARSAAEAVYAKITEVNSAYENAVASGDFDAADKIVDTDYPTLYTDVLAAFKACEDTLVRLTWEDVSVFPHELPAMNLEALLPALEALQAGNATEAVDEYLWVVDNNWYAYDWSRATYDYYTDYVLEASPEKLMWGAGRIVGYEDLYDTIRSLMAKSGEAAADLSAETARLEEAIDTQIALLISLTEQETADIEAITARLEAIAA